MDHYASVPRKFEKTRISWRILTAIVAVALLGSAHLASAAIDKNAMHQEMLSLAQQMGSLGPQMRTNPQAASAYKAAEDRYRQISASLGGDDPGHVLSGGVNAKARRTPLRVRRVGKVAPAAPAACGATTTNFTNSTPVAISATGTPVVTSTIVVSGVGPFLYDLDVTTFLQHTFSSDLDVTITSPAGTVVTLTTDNGSTFDDVFNGTVWDDNADPDTQVPYTANNNLVVEHTYANLTLASPLVPEEPLGAFIGEDPNGTWTITISDDSNLDGGSLNSWSLDIQTFTCAGAASADLSIAKTDGVASTAPGSTTTYTITAANAGPSAANPVTVTDNFPAACTFISYTSTATGGATGNSASGTGNINDAALNLPAGSTVTYTAACLIDHGATGSLANTATISSAVVDPVPANNSATDTDTLVPSADLFFNKTLTTTGTIHVGDNVTFTLAVTDFGPSDATGVTVTDILPAGLTYVSNDCGATFASPTLTWNIGALAAMFQVLSLIHI